MALVKHEPTALDLRPSRRWPMLGLFDEMENELERLWQRGFGGLAKEAELLPKIEVAKKKDRYVFKAELPGVEKKDIHVSITGGALVLEGERRQESEIEEEELLHRECTYGRFYRSFDLGFDVDPKDVKARFRNGVLKLEIPMPKKAMDEKKAEIAIE